jgi:hypothetical protein
MEYLKECHTFGTDEYVAHSPEFLEALTYAINLIEKCNTGVIAGLICEKFGEQSMKGNPVPLDFDYNGLAETITQYLLGKEASNGK